MKHNYKTIIIWWLTVLALILLGTFLTSNAKAEEIDHQGIEFSFGGFDNILLDETDQNYDFNWATISLFNKHSINNNWNINLYGNLGYLHWSSTNNNSDKNTFLFGAELVLYRTIYKNLSVGAGGGLATLTETDLPELGNSGLYGTLTGRLNLEVSKDYGLELSVDHISDVIQNNDGGKNVLSLKIYYMF